MTQLPPLNALRAFESAARHASFSRAAEELCVTPGAISRHVSKLEDYLGVRLFLRRHRQVELTRRGSAYFKDISVALDHISQATLAHRFDQRSSARSAERSFLKLKAPPGFARQWLVPRLARFQEKYPTVAIQITTSHEPPDFGAEDIDAAVRSGARVEGDFETEWLFSEVLAPVCSPSLIERGRGRLTPEILAGSTLLYSKERPNDWPQWLAAAGLAEIGSARILTFDNYNLTYQAMIDGLGFAIAKIALVADHLAGGSLVAPFEPRVRNPNSYHLLLSRRSAEAGNVARFREWVVHEAQLTRQIVQD